MLKTLLELLPNQLGLHRFLKKCFRIGISGGQHLSAIPEIEKAIVAEILNQKHWGECIPSSWFRFEEFIRTEKENHKILTVDEIKNHMQRITETKPGVQKEEEDEETEEDEEEEEILSNLKDMLKFFHEIGKIIYFNEDGLDDKMILDVQWFVNAFKEVITDSKHAQFTTKADWTEFNETGILRDDVLCQIWRDTDTNGNFERYKNDILTFMERLGLLVNGKGKAHLVPSVTKRDYKQQEKSKLASTTQKTSVLYFHFDFLPLFVYHRLIVSCFSFDGWEPLTNGYKCIYKNVSEFKFKSHFIFLGVDDDDIRLQVYRPNSDTKLDINVGWEIRETIEKELHKLTKTFHKNIAFSLGFYCMSKKDGGGFISEEKMKIITGGICPHHETRTGHNVKKDEFLWLKDKVILLL